MKIKDKNIKTALILAGAAGAALILFALNQIDFDAALSGMFSGGKAAETEKIRFAEPDYEADIYGDKEYLEKNRYIFYSDGTVSTVISEQNNEYGKIGEFFIRYFKALTDGDAAAYNAMFTDSYYKNSDTEPYEKFTMQKIYDISVEKLSEEQLEEGGYDGWTRYTYKLGYRIMENDGTFRKDMPSDTRVPVVAEILYDPSDYSFKINSIVKAINPGQ